MRAIHTLGALVAAVVALSGCGVQSQPASSSPGVLASPSVTPSPFPSDDEFAALVGAVTGTAAAAGGELDELWQWTLDEEMGGALGTYHEPGAVAGYRAGQSPASACARGVPAREWLNNARYCGADQSIYFDEDWLRSFRTSGGNFAPAAVLAHEWGHHVQLVTGIASEPDTFSIALELQADCFAGIFVGDREPIKDGVWTLGDADLTSAATTFFSLGNTKYKASEWFSADEHGSQLERLMAFGTGYEGSVSAGSPFGRVSAFAPWCYGYRDFRPAQPVHLGPGELPSLIPPPGRAASQNGDEYVIAPLSVGGRTSSRIRLRWLAADKALLDDVNERFPGMRVVIDAKQLPPFGSSAGPIAYFLYEQTDAGGITRSGLYGVVALADKSNLLIDVERDEPAPDPSADPKTTPLAEELMAFGQIASRLCVPGQSSEPGTQFSAACAYAQQ